MEKHSQVKILRKRIFWATNGSQPMTFQILVGRSNHWDTGDSWWARSYTRFRTLLHYLHFIQVNNPFINNWAAKSAHHMIMNDVMILQVKASFCNPKWIFRPRCRQWNNIKGNIYFTLHKKDKEQDQVVVQVDNAIHQSMVCFVNTYPLDSDLSVDWELSSLWTTGVKTLVRFDLILNFNPNIIIIQHLLKEGVRVPRQKCPIALVYHF